MNFEQNKKFTGNHFLYFHPEVRIEHNISLDFINGSSKVMTSLKAINNFYLSVIERSILDCNNKYIFYCFKKNIRNNIDIITYDFEKVHLLLLSYYLRYKFKKIVTDWKHDLSNIFKSSVK